MNMESKHHARFPTHKPRVGAAFGLGVTFGVTSVGNPSHTASPAVYSKLLTVNGVNR